MNLEDRIIRGRRAEQLMNDALMKEATEHIEAECWRMFKELAPTDTEGMAQVKGMQYMHAKYIAFLNKAINDGKMARAEVERKKKPTFLDRFRS